MDHLNNILTDPQFQAAAVIILTIVFKALWNALRDVVMAIEVSGSGPAKVAVKSMRSFRKPLSRFILELTIAWVSLWKSDKPAKKIILDTLKNLAGKK